MCVTPGAPATSGKVGHRAVLLSYHPRCYCPPTTPTFPIYFLKKYYFLATEKEGAETRTKGGVIMS